MQSSCLQWLDAYFSRHQLEQPVLRVCGLKWVGMLASSAKKKTWSDAARFYLIGIGGRGQKALRKIGAWEALERWHPTLAATGEQLLVYLDTPLEGDLIYQTKQLSVCRLKSEQRVASWRSSCSG